MKFYVQLALTYRLSLKSMSRLIKKGEIDTYNLLISDETTRDAIIYLFDYEAKLEPEEVEERKFLQAEEFYRAYLQAHMNEDKEQKKILVNQLVEVDHQFSPIKMRLSKMNHDDPTAEDLDVISRYRLKYAYSGKAICRAINIWDDMLRRYEKKLDGELGQRVEKMNQYFNINEQDRRSNKRY